MCKGMVFNIQKFSIHDVLYFLETVVKRWCLHGSLHYRLKDRIKKMKSRKFHIIWITARNTATNDSYIDSLVISGQKLDSTDISSIAEYLYEQSEKKMYMKAMKSLEIHHNIFSNIKEGIRLE